MKPYFLMAAVSVLMSGFSSNASYAGACKIDAKDISLSYVGEYSVPFGGQRLDYGVFHLTNRADNTFSLDTISISGFTEVPDIFVVFYSRDRGAKDAKWDAEIPATDALAIKPEKTRIRSMKSTMLSVPMGWLSHLQPQSFSREWRMELYTSDGCMVSSSPFSLVRPERKIE